MTGQATRRRFLETARRRLNAFWGVPALHYALGLPGVATAMVGCKSAEGVRRATEAASRFSPLREAELARLLDRGKVLAAQWGTHFGPVVAEK